MMPWTRTLTSMVALGALLAALACGGGSTASTPSTTATAASATPSTRTPSAAPVLATKAEIEAASKKLFPGDRPAGCPVHDRAACPTTDRLYNRLLELEKPVPGQPGPLTEFCRCQNAPTASFSVVGEPVSGGGTGHVVLYGDVAPPTTPIRLDMIFTRQSDGTLLLDDTRCTGRGAETSIYATPVPICSQ